MAPPLSFGSRFGFAWVCFFRVLFDGAFARRALEATEPRPELEAPKVEKKAADPIAAAPDPALLEAAREDGALALLAAFQRQGRFVDFIQEDLAGAADADVGAVARTVHDGCRSWLREHATIVTVRADAEGSLVEVDGDIDHDVQKLTGNVGAKGPRKGTVVHRGWRAEKLALPTRSGGDGRVLAAAEIEVR